MLSLFLRAWWKEEKALSISENDGLVVASSLQHCSINWYKGGGQSSCGVVWCGVVWCGVVWCGVVSCGGVWCLVVWCSVVFCGEVWCGVV